MVSCIVWELIWNGFRNVLWDFHAWVSVSHFVDQWAFSWRDFTVDIAADFLKALTAGVLNANSPLVEVLAGQSLAA